VVISKARREAVVAILGPCDFFGEGCLAGQPVRIGNATMIAPTRARVSFFMDKFRRLGFIGYDGSPANRLEINSSAAKRRAARLSETKIDVGYLSCRPTMPARKKPFDARAFLETPGLKKRVVTYARGDVIFAQGDPCDSVMYVRTGGTRLTVVSHAGREAVVATLSPGEFFGEGALSGHPVRLETARATMASEVLVVPKRQMIRLLHSQHAFSDRFIAHMLLRNARLEADLVDQLFNSSEKRLARTLLLLARLGKSDKPQRVLPSVSQETLADMIGTTRSRVNFFLNKFRKLGFIGYDAGGLTINPSLISVVAHD
jgi:CRP-like cAMP-binding protein